MFQYQAVAVGHCRTSAVQVANPKDTAPYSSPDLGYLQPRSG
ncbi:hypothetical protein [Propionispira arboris]|nr:hypothetical protein [Propionispira arboris]